VTNGWRWGLGGVAEDVWSVPALPRLGVFFFFLDAADVVENCLAGWRSWRTPLEVEVDGNNEDEELLELIWRRRTDFFK